MKTPNKTLLSAALIALCAGSAPALAAPPFSHGEKAFNEARQLLAKDQVDKLSDEELYRAAVQGMLAARGRKWDQLLTPEEYADLKTGLSGELIGIGVELKFDPNSGVATILSVVPGSAAERAGMVAGDLVVKVDGKSFKNGQERDLVAAIRGKEGDVVALTLLRGDALVEQKIRRERVKLVPVVDQVLPDGVGVLTIESFSEKTPAMVEDALNRLRAQKIRALVVDLRGDSGGLFDKMVDTANLLLPQGSNVATSIDGDGKRTQWTTKRPSVLGRLPTAVLVDSMTFSSAEILAAALKSNLGATVIGNKTGGKWNAQRLEALSNGYALRYTVSIFETPNGDRPDGVGLTPDMEVDLAPGECSKTRRMSDYATRLQADPQLRTAISVLKR